MRDLLLALARSLVLEPARVSVHEREEGSIVRLELRVAPEDRGRVIGRHGRTAQALRTVLGFAARRRGRACDVEIVG